MYLNLNRTVHIVRTRECGTKDVLSVYFEFSGMSISMEPARVKGESNHVWYSHIEADCYEQKKVPIEVLYGCLANNEH
jgi:hypothetical protein